MGFLNFQISISSLLFVLFFSVNLSCSKRSFESVKHGDLYLKDKTNDFNTTEISNRTCSNQETDFDYQHFIFVYKDNVRTITECCDFCNSNARCIVWSLQFEINRCYLKYERGKRVFARGFTSGFSDEYLSTLPVSIPFSTTQSSTITNPLVTTTILSSTPNKPQQLLKCDEIVGVELGNMYTAQATNTTLTMCCNFCATYSLCKMYTYYPLTKKCLLYDSFNLPYQYCSVPADCQSGRIFLTTTKSGVIGATTLLPSLYLPELNKEPLNNSDSMCYFENDIHYFSDHWIIEHSDSNITECCLKCELNANCLSWTLYPTYSLTNSKTCRLYDAFRISPQWKLGYTSGFNSKTTGFGFYSINDQFQLKFFDLTGNYSFLNTRYVYDGYEQQVLKEVVQSIEDNVLSRVQSYLKESVFRIIVNNISYLRSRQCIIASFIVILDPRITDLNQAEQLLTHFNFLIDNNIGFNAITFNNEPYSNSSLLANLSSFALRTINMQSINQLSYLYSAIITTTTPRIITTTTTKSTTSTSSTTTTTTTLSTPTTSISSTTPATTLRDTLLELSGDLIKMNSCFMENDILYLGTNIEVKESVKSVPDCCNLCTLKLGCKSWVFSHLNKTCFLKASFHGEGFVNMKGYSSGFIDPQFDSYLKISQSIGVVDFETLLNETREINYTAVVSVEEKLTNLWKNLLKSNIELVELETNYQIRLNGTQKPIMVLSYNIKLDKRVVDDPSTIMKLAQIINMTLIEPKSNVYSNLTSEFNTTTSFVLPQFLITLTRVDIFEVTTAVSITTEDTFSDCSYSFNILSGLQFKFVNNSIYAFLSNSREEHNLDEERIYNSIVSGLENQIESLLNGNLDQEYIQNISVVGIYFNPNFGLVDVDYDVILKSKYIRTESDALKLQRTLNERFAVPGSKNNPLLTVKLPFVNMNGVKIETLVPVSTSKFKLVSKLDSFQLTTNSYSTEMASFWYIGCYNDSHFDRDLNFTGMTPSLVNYTSMTIKLCVDHCKQYGQIYAGLQYGKECFCGSSYGRLGKLTKSKCFYPCTGNRLEFCGGISANDIYNTGIQTVTQSAFTTEDKKITTEMTTKFPPETTTVQGSQMSKETTFYTTVELTTATETSTFNSSNTSDATVSYYNNEKNFTSSTRATILKTQISSDSTKENLNTTPLILSIGKQTSEQLQKVTENINEKTEMTTNSATESYTTSIWPIFSSLNSTSLLIDTNKVSYSSLSTHPLLSVITNTPGNLETERQVINSINSTILVTQATKEVTTAVSVVTTETKSTTTTTTTKIIVPVSTSNGVLSTPFTLEPVTEDAYLITTIRVNKSVNIESQDFRRAVTLGLNKAYLLAFTRAYAAFLNQKARQFTEPASATIQVNVIGFIKTGQTNADNTKDEVKLRYYVLNNDRVVDATFAADSIHLVSKQEMAQLLDQEIVDVGFVEKRPYAKPKVEDPKYWIIGAVLGPLAFLVFVFWLVAYIYYKCINPKRSRDKRKAHILTEESANSSQEDIRVSKSKKNLDNQPEPNQSTPKTHQSLNRNISLDHFNSKSSFSDQSSIESNIENLPQPKQKKTGSRKKNAINVLLSSSTSSPAYNMDQEIEETIRKKAELEKWRNKQRYREKESIEKLPPQIKPETSFHNSTKIMPINSDLKAGQTSSQQPLLKPSFHHITPSFQQTQSKISIVSREHVDLFTPALSHNNFVLSEDSKSVLKAQHVPVKVHVDHKPSNQDTQRIYNPYFIKNEFEQYSQNGFLFEPIVSQEQAGQVANLKAADAVFGTESISPYNRNNRSALSYKNANAQSDKLTDSVRGYTNLYAIDSSTEFQNLNNLKNADYRIKQSNPNVKSGSEFFTSMENSSFGNITEMPSQRLVANNAFEDEYEIARKLQKNSSSDNSNQLVSSISQELKKMNPVYKS